MEISPFQFWSGIIGIAIVQIAQIIISYRNNKAQAPLIEAQSENAMSEGWERLSKEYARQIESLKKLEVENAELRPLVLKLALQEKEIEQVKEDKADWKRYAEKLTQQIQEFGQIPIPFRRVPSDGDTNEKIRTVQFPIGTTKKSGTAQEDDTIVTNRNGD